MRLLPEILRLVLIDAVGLRTYFRLLQRSSTAPSAMHVGSSYGRLLVLITTGLVLAWQASRCRPTTRWSVWRHRFFGRPSRATDPSISRWRLASASRWKGRACQAASVPQATWAVRSTRMARTTCCSHCGTGTLRCTRPTASSLSQLTTARLAAPPSAEKGRVDTAVRRSQGMASCGKSAHATHSQQ